MEPDILRVCDDTRKILRFSYAFLGLNPNFSNFPETNHLNSFSNNDSQKAKSLFYRTAPMGIE